MENELLTGVPNDKANRPYLKTGFSLCGRKYEYPRDKFILLCNYTDEYRIEHFETLARLHELFMRLYRWPVFPEFLWEFHHNRHWKNKRLAKMVKDRLI